MPEKYDRRPAFEKFMENVNGLLADRNFREVLMELDAEEESVSLLAPDPAAFLRYRGVKIPEDFILSVESHTEAPAKSGGGGGGGTICYCLRICWWRWCITICICRIVVAS
jgi:hypothetical protein